MWLVILLHVKIQEIFTHQAVIDQGTSSLLSSHPIPQPNIHPIMKEVVICTTHVFLQIATELLQELERNKYLCSNKMTTFYNETKEIESFIILFFELFI